MPFPFEVLMFLLLAALSTSHAAMLGNPVSDPATGHIGLAATLSSEHNLLEQSGCTGDSCEASRVPFFLGGRLDANVFQNLGLFVEAGRVVDRVDAAAWKGTGVAFGGGGHLALPVSRTFWVAASGQVQVGSASPTSETSTTEVTWSQARLALTGDLTAADHSAFLYFGPTYSPLYKHVTEGDTPFTLQPVQPFGGLVGAEVVSDTLGAPWSAWSGHLTAGGEFSWQGGYGVTVWAGVSF